MTHGRDASHASPLTPAALSNTFKATPGVMGISALRLAGTMTIYALKPRFQALLRPLVRRCHAAGVTANQVTLLAGALSLATGTALVLLAPHPAWFLLIPVWMLVRMALNAIDGMLAREHGQQSPLGAYLNELADVVSDAALFMPFALVQPFDPWAIGLVILLAALAEMTGVVGVLAGASRRYDGPMGKSDRAFVFGALALWIGLAGALPAWTHWLPWIIAALLLWTIANRIRNGVREATQQAADHATR